MSEPTKEKPTQSDAELERLKAEEDAKRKDREAKSVERCQELSDTMDEVREAAKKEN